MGSQTWGSPDIKTSTRTRQATGNPGNYPEPGTNPWALEDPAYRAILAQVFREDNTI